MGDLDFKIPFALSFDDVLLVPRLSSVLPSQAKLQTSLGGDLNLNIPLLAAAMDTVTEDEMAIALAREGGLGVIHRNWSIEEQTGAVARVKRFQNMVIENPYTVAEKNSVLEVREFMQKYGVSGFPVLDNGALVGIVTSRDIHNRQDSELVSEVMTPQEKLITASKGVDFEKARDLMASHRIEKLPLIDDACFCGLMTATDIENRLKYANAAKDSEGHLLCGAAVGVGEEALKRAESLLGAGVDGIFIDAATGHTENVLNTIRELSQMTEKPVIAGNVVTAKGAKDLVEAGASAVKVGVGPGSICTTRVIAGVGMPQFSAILNVVEYCQKKGVAVIADGGVRYSGDIVKALAGGASAVMLGSALAGTKESPGEVIYFQARRFKAYRGMGSLGALRRGGRDRYQQGGAEKFVAEGVEARVPYKGPVAEVIFELMGGLRSGMGYLGAVSLSELNKRAEFVRITQGGLRESHVHDVTITEEPKNYQSLNHS